MRRGVSLVVAACLAASAVWAAEVPSGLGKGEFVPAFNVAIRNASTKMTDPLGIERYYVGKGYAMFRLFR